MDKYSYRHRLKHFYMDVQVSVKGKVHILVKKKTRNKNNPQKKATWSDQIERLIA